MSKTRENAFVLVQRQKKHCQSSHFDDWQEACSKSHISGLNAWCFECNVCGECISTEKYAKNAARCLCTRKMSKKRVWDDGLSHPWRAPLWFRSGSRVMVLACYLMPVSASYVATVFVAVAACLIRHEKKTVCWLKIRKRSGFGFWIMWRSLVGQDETQSARTTDSSSAVSLCVSATLRAWKFFFFSFCLSLPSV